MRRISTYRWRRWRSSITKILLITAQPCIISGIPSFSTTPTALALEDTVLTDEQSGIQLSGRFADGVAMTVTPVVYTPASLEGYRAADSFGYDIDLSSIHTTQVLKTNETNAMGASDVYYTAATRLMWEK